MAFSTKWSRDTCTGSHWYKKKNNGKIDSCTCAWGKSAAYSNDTSVVHVRTVKSALQMRLLYYTGTIVRLPNGASQPRAYFRMKTAGRWVVPAGKSRFPFYKRQRLQLNPTETGKVRLSMRSCTLIPSCEPPISCYSSYSSFPNFLVFCLFHWLLYFFPVFHFAPLVALIIDPCLYNSARFNTSASWFVKNVEKFRCTYLL